MSRELSYEELNQQLEDSCHLFEELIQKEADTKLEMSVKLENIHQDIQGTRNHISNIKCKIQEKLDEVTEGKKRKILKDRFKELKNKYIVHIPEEFNDIIWFFKITKYEEVIDDNYIPIRTTPLYKGKLVSFEFKDYLQGSEAVCNFDASLAFAFSTDYIILPAKIAESYIEKFYTVMNKNHSAFSKEVSSLVKATKKCDKLNLGEPGPLPEGYHYTDYTPNWFI